MFETMASGTPTIALEGPFLRSRFVAGAYRQMGLADAPIASSIEEYVELAVALMSDDEKRLVLRQKIRNAAIHHLYDRLEMVRGFEDFAVDAISRARSCA
jgi:predicted O-linked N-acetylglucosamine transferase (SPINDLY family)